ncbi:MAG: hypothetical protein ABSH22_13025 [Tepidisphaeraceae bacterium]
MQPTPQPKPTLQAADDPPITMVALINPSILLMDSRNDLQLLLSRDTLIDPDAIYLRGVRLIAIPVGWRLWLIRLTSRFFKIRLPNELEFLQLRVDTEKNPSPVTACEKEIGKAKKPTPLIPLTDTEYQTLMEMNGRTLHRWVVERFGLESRSARSFKTTRRRAA